jgi:hypothetical protein
MHSLWLLCPIVLAVGCASSNSNQSTSTVAGEAGVINFADTKHGVRLVYPAQWKEQTFLRPQQALLQVTRGSSEVLSLVAQDNPQHPTTSADLPAIEQAALEQYRGKFNDFNLLEQTDTTVGGQPARRIVFVGKQFGITFQTMIVLVAHNGVAYVFMYATDPKTFEAGRAGVQRVIDSVEFVK